MKPGPKQQRARQTSRRVGKTATSTDTANRPAHKPAESAGEDPPAKETSPVPANKRKAKPRPLPAKPRPFIVGVGASAGGLEALRAFVSTLSEDERLTYVIAQHLSPTHHSMLVPLLARETKLRVAEVSQGLIPEAACIYVTPARWNVTVHEGRMRLTEATQAGVPKPSIDDFFITLAEYAGEHAVGIILSGTGSDGARGARAIRAAGGTMFAQDDASAKYAGMPHAAVDTGCVDFVLPPHQIAARLTELVDRGALAFDQDTQPPLPFDRICALVRSRTGVDFHHYKEATVQRRVRRRMVATSSAHLDGYEHFLKEHADEVEILSREILISVTQFFRDTDAFDGLAQTIDEMVAERPEGGDLRIWIPGCATGEEAYSIAFVLADALTRHRKYLRAQIFATDIDTGALAIARRGVYSASDVEPVSATHRERYFVVAGSQYRVAKHIRELVVFSVQNLLRDPPFLRLDMISCRNLLIYLRPTVQSRVLQTFAFSLTGGGFLFLGKSEGIHNHEQFFSAVPGRPKLFRKLAIAVRIPPAPEITGGLTQSISRPSANVPTLADRAFHALQPTLLSTAVVVDEALNLKHVFGDVSSYVRLPAGSVELNLFRLAIPPLRAELRSLIMKAQRTSEHIAFQRVSGKGLDTPLRLSAFPLPGEGKNVTLYLVKFETLKESRSRTQGDRTRNEDQLKQILELEEQLAASREHLQTVVEELETSNEELQSLNEEMSSANEELQSTNEELETTNEELQSTNEELTTVNEELEAKTHELIAVNNDLTNVRDSMTHPLVVIDEHQRLLLFNKAAFEVFSLGHISVGESFFSIPSALDTAVVRNALTRVISHGEQMEHQFTGDRCYLMRATPYMNERRERRGAVIFFIENTDQIHAQIALRESNARLSAAERFARSTIDALPEHLCVLDEKGNIIAVNSAWNAFAEANGAIARRCGVGANYLDACRIAVLAGDEYARKLVAGMGEVMRRRTDRFDMEYPCHSPDKERWFVVSVSAFEGEGPRHLAVLHVDVSALKESERMLHLRSRALNSATNGICIANGSVEGFPLVYVNKAFTDITGYSEEEVIGQNCRFLQKNDSDQPELNKLRVALKNTTPCRVLLRNYKKSGQMFWNELSVYPVSGEPMNTVYFVGVQRDVTQLVQSEEALKRSIERERLALNFAGVGSFEWNIASGQIVSSELNRMILGLENHHGDFSHGDLRAMIHIDDKPVFDDGIKVCLSGHASLDIEFRVVWPDATVHWVHMKGDVEADANRIPLRLLCLTQDVSQRREADERVRYVAHHDVLTGLPNRTLLRDRLQQAINAAKRHRTKLAVLFLDLDHFKHVNDSLGHQVGDMLLQSVAARLKDCTRDTDTLCRQSGDEYIVVLCNVRDQGEISHVAGHIIEELAKPYEIDNHELIVGASVGISVFPDDATTIDVLIRNADAAMYHAKGNGRNNYQFFSPEMNVQAMKRLSVSNELRHAADRGELRLFYQPELSVDGQRLIGIEALVRWMHPTRGLVLPDDFIPIAEDTEILAKLSEWVLNEACRQNRAWQDGGFPHLPIAVNFAPKQFRHRSVIEKVAHALHSSGMDARYLELELTESTIMQNPEQATEILRDLHGLGVRLVVDDFGTGYSSLSYLKRFPIDKLKIDRSFVQDVPHNHEAAAIVRAVIQLAHSLRLEVVAEGVEKADQLAFLSAENCTAFQGYIVAPALDAKAFTAFLQGVVH